MSTLSRFLFFLVLCFLLFCTTSWGGGLFLYEQGTPDAPFDRQLRYGTGIQYDWNEDVTLGFAYEYLDAGDAAINQYKGPLAGKLLGDYNTNEVHVFAFNINWKF